jgi:hypothetical protein
MKLGRKGMPQSTEVDVSIVLIMRNFKVRNTLIYWRIMKINMMKKVRGLVRQRTVPTERSPLVGEVSANFSG